MAKSWLELQENLRTGAAKLPNPVPNSSCGVSENQTAQTDILGLPNLGELTQPVNDFLSGVQGEIDQFGADVMGVLQDIGAFIPPELQGSGGSNSTTEDGKSKVAAVSSLNHTILANGEVTVTDGSDPDTGDSFYSIVTSSGGGITLDTDGSVILTAGKNPSSDPKTGRVDIIAQGAGVQKYGEFLAIEVNNDNEALSAENPSVKGAAFSIVVHGNVEIQSTSGDVKVGGKNIVFSASDSIELNGADIKLYAGSSSTTTGGSSGKAKEEQGGIIELKCGLLKNSSAAQQNIEGGTYNKVDGEKFITTTNSQGNVTIESTGTLNIKSGGDMIEEIGGRKLTTVFAALPGVSLGGGLIPPRPQVLGVSAGYYITNKYPIIPAGGTSAEIPPLVHIDSNVSAGGHGFTVEAPMGNIGLYSRFGSVGMATDFSAFADITPPGFVGATVPKPLLQLKSPGAYITALDNLSMGAKINTSLFAGPIPTGGTPPIDDSINITPGTIRVSALKGGIFLN